MGVLPGHAAASSHTSVHDDDLTVVPFWQQKKQRVLGMLCGAGTEHSLRSAGLSRGKSILRNSMMCVCAGVCVKQTSYEV